MTSPIDIRAAQLRRDGEDLEVPGMYDGRSTVFEKAQSDPFQYICKLRTGETVRFEELVVLIDGWVRLNNIAGQSGFGAVHFGFVEPFTFARGLEVRAADIVWMADAGGYDS